MIIDARSVELDANIHCGAVRSRRVPIEVMGRDRLPEAWTGEALLAAERGAERWTRQRRICERLSIAASVPLACLMIARLGFEGAIVQIALGLWSLALLSIFVCTTAVAHAQGRIAGLPPRAGRQRLYPVD
jgi:hypothetical protein